MVGDKVYWGNNVVMFVWDIRRTDKTIIGRVDERFIPEELQHFFAVFARLSKGFVSVDPSDLKPIPLTPEILERNGFEKVQNLLVLQWENGVYPSMIFVEYNPENYCLFINDMMFPKPVRFLHELHHILMDCGIEKEFVI